MLIVWFSWMSKILEDFEFYSSNTGQLQYLLNIILFLQHYFTQSNDSTVHLYCLLNWTSRNFPGTAEHCMIAIASGGAEHGNWAKCCGCLGPRCRWLRGHSVRAVIECLLTTWTRCPSCRWLRWDEVRVVTNNTETSLHNLFCDRVCVITN